MITAFSTVPIKAPAPERDLPQYATFEEAVAAMLADATRINTDPRRKTQAVHEPKTTLTEPQRQTLLAVTGRAMTSADVAEASGIERRRVTGFLSTLCTKGLLERVGYDGNSVKWRTTRKGRKWQEKVR